MVLSLWKATKPPPLLSKREMTPSLRFSSRTVRDRGASRKAFARSRYSALVIEPNSLPCFSKCESRLREDVKPTLLVLAGNPPTSAAGFACFRALLEPAARVEALPVEALPVEALPVEALPVEALPVEAWFAGAVDVGTTLVVVAPPPALLPLALLPGSLSVGKKNAATMASSTPPIERLAFFCTELV